MTEVSKSTAPDTSDQGGHIRSVINNAATYINATVTPGRRRALALTKLEEAGMWAVKAATQGDD